MQSRDQRDAPFCTFLLASTFPTCNQMLFQYASVNIHCLKISMHILILAMHDRLLYRGDIGGIKPQLKEGGGASEAEG